MVRTTQNTSGIATEVGPEVDRILKPMNGASMQATLHSARPSDGAWCIRVSVDGPNPILRTFGYANEAKAREVFAGI